MNSSSEGAIPQACTQLSQKIETPFAMAVGLKNGDTFCYVNYRTPNGTAMAQNLRNMCEDSDDSRLAIGSLIDASLEDCLRAGAAGCRGVATHFGILDQGRVVAPLPPNSGFPRLLRPLSVPYSPIPRDALHSFEGTWASTSYEQLGDYENGKHKNACTDPDVSKTIISLSPIVPDQTAKFYRDYWGYIYTKDENVNFQGKYRVISASGGRVGVVTNSGGTCVDEVNMTRAQYAYKYPQESYSQYLLKQKREKNISDAKFDADNNGKVTDVATWFIDSHGDLNMGDAKLHRCQ
jgi:hypothetical protein